MKQKTLLGYLYQFENAINRHNYSMDLLEYPLLNYVDLANDNIIVEQNQIRVEKARAKLINAIKKVTQK